MLALKSCEHVAGLSVMTADELYYVNGGSAGGNVGKVSLPSYSTSSNSGWSISSKGLSLTTGNTTVTISIDKGPSVKLDVKIKL